MQFSLTQQLDPEQISPSYQSQGVMTYGILESIIQIPFRNQEHLFVTLTLCTGVGRAPHNRNLHRFPAGSAGTGAQVIVPIDGILAVVGVIINELQKMRYIVDRVNLEDLARLPKYRKKRT